MKPRSKDVVVFCAAVMLLAGTAWSQVHFEITGFGKYNLNLGFPGTTTMESDLRSVYTGYREVWQAFWTEPALGQKGGFGFGGRLAVEFTPRLALEASFEYDLVEIEFDPDILADAQAEMDDLGLESYFTWVASGGNVLRFYGNLNFNLVTQGPLIPYITAGLGLTQFKIEPSVDGDRPSWGERLRIYYDESASALTFNGGLGMKYFFTPTIGLRLDGRVFVGSPKFQQYFHYRLFGYDFYEDGKSVLQEGTHADLCFNIGLIARF